MAQKLILFEDILNCAAIKSNKTLMAELGKLAEYVFGESGFSIEKAEKKADDIQIWSGDELYKALSNDYCTAFRFKSAFVIEADGYVGPVMAWFFEPDGAFDDQIVALTCESNGLFNNPRYVCGLLISEYDLERLLGDLGGDQDDDEEEDDDDEDEEDWEGDEDDEDVEEDEDDEDWEDDEDGEDDEDDEDEDEEDEDEDDEDEDKEEISDDKLNSSVLQAVHEIKEKEEATDKGDLILKLVSYEGSIIKMMTVLSTIEGIDEEAAFNILQKMPSVVREGISAKAAMKIGSILEDAGATVELARASDSAAKAEAPKPEPGKHKSSLKPQSAAKPKPAEPKRPSMEYVDLGLSVKWAKWNLGATAPEESGDFFAWGETSPKSEYESDNYRFSEKGKGLVKYNSKDNYGSVVDNLKQLELCDDAAHVILGGDWRMPTAKEIKELNDNCSFSRTTINGVKGSKLKSKKKGYTDRWIFFPDTGFKSGEKVLGCKDGFYWTSSLYTRRPNCGLMIFCNDWDDDRSDRYHGLAIRPVFK